MRYTMMKKVSALRRTLGRVCLTAALSCILALSAQAQEFMNENHFADVSRVQCLLRKMMSKEYHGLIDQIKECQDPHAIFNIHGGNNLIAPTASQAEQKLVEKPADEIKKDKE